MSTEPQSAVIFHDLFTSWDDVKKEFGSTYAAPDTVDEVIYARYGYEDYSGYAIVVARQGDKYLVATGSHCSCCGLEEGGWQPEEYDRATLIAALKKAISNGERGYGPFGGNAKDILANMGVQ